MTSGDKTKWIFEDDGADEAAEFTESLTQTPAGGTPGDETPTKVFDTGGEKTQLWPFGGEEAGLEVDPVVGWLVVIKGPGLGRSLNLGIGVNAIGRDRDERVALPFGDKLISQRDHAKVFYDEAAREFFIAHGSGKNITRLNGSIVANPVPLPSHSVIELTKATHLRFVAFCDESFDWSDVIGGSDADS